MQLAAGVRSPMRTAFPRVSSVGMRSPKRAAFPHVSCSLSEIFLPARLLVSLQAASVFSPQRILPTLPGPSKAPAEASRAILLRGNVRARHAVDASQMTKKGRYTHYYDGLLVLLLLVLALLLVELARVGQNHDDDDPNNRQDDEGDEHLHLALLPPHLFSERLRARLEHACLTL